ncbi:MAG: hypothetical protein ACI9HU_001933 [Colwellia sp.]|jgi:hypothetical protein
MSSTGVIMKFKRNALAIAVMVATSALTACGSSSNDPEPVIEVPADPVNVAPTAITLSADTVDENAVGAEIGTLITMDANTGDTFTFTTDNTDFVITGDMLALAAESSFDFEKTTSVALNVTVTDNGGLAHTQELTIEVNDVLDTYSFMSKLGDDTQSSVAYSGQIARQALISEFTHFIGNKLQTQLDDGTLASREAVITELDKYFRTTDEQWDGFEITFLEDSKQKFFANISSSAKSLVGKIAGNDTKGQEVDFLTDFAGWAPKGDLTPESLVDMFLSQLADNAATILSGAVRVDPITNELIPVYVNEDGTDLKQLIQKFLLVSITYSQSAGDYLGADYEGKGLTTDNISEVKNGYTNLEHQFDEGFGYFGATIDYLAYNDKEIGGKVKSADDGRDNYNGKHDTNGDGEYDLLSEVIFGAASNAAKRDLGTVGNTNPTDITTQTMAAFIAGRKIINDNVGSALTEEQLNALYIQRDLAIGGWEKALAATAIHYINDLNADLEPLKNGEEFDFKTTAKHFSELKGFALGLQFNPFSKLSSADFIKVHDLIGTKPVLAITDIEQYQEDLIVARDILRDALEYDAVNVANW